MAVRQGKLTLQRMIELYESGMDTAEIAEKNDWSYLRVKRNNVNSC